MDNNVFTFSLLMLGFIFGRVIAYIGHEPTLVPGAKLLGNIVALGRHGASFLHACRAAYGSVFTINLGIYMTFFDDKALIHQLFSAPDEDITFRPAVEQFTQRVFGLPSKEFFPKHSSILRDLRHLLVPSELGPHSKALSSHVNDLLPLAFPSGATEVELFSAVKLLVFRSAVEVLFSSELFDIAGGAEALESTFFEFEEAFELAASPWPHTLQPRFTKSRALLLKWLGELHKREAFHTTPAGMLFERSGIRIGLASNLLLAVLWASQANTVPATFWTLAFLLLPENKAHLTQVLSELETEMKKEGDPDLAIFKLSTERKSLVSRCVGESIRLRAHSIDLRIASKDLKLTRSDGSLLSIPKGRILAVCPWLTHHDDGNYKDAWTFDPNRESLILGDGSAVVPSLSGLAFGGGAYRCPGRFFAEMEVATILLTLLRKMELSLLMRKEGHPSDPPAPWYSIYAPLLPLLLGEEGAKYGLGQLGHLETWVKSGDEKGLLPKCNLIRLVGLKVPDESCWVKGGSREGVAEKKTRRKSRVN